MKADLKKPLEESIKEHLGKAIDRLDPVQAALFGGLAYLGYETFGDWKGALYGPVSLSLATAPNEIAAAAGVIGLASLGVCAVGKNLLDDVKDVTVPGIQPYATKERCAEGFTRMKTGLNPEPGYEEMCVPNWLVWYYTTFVGWHQIPEPEQIPTGPTYTPVWHRHADGKEYLHCAEGWVLAGKDGVYLCIQNSLIAEYTLKGWIVMGLVTR